MSPPAYDLRSNQGTWSVPSCRLPAVAALMIQTLPPEKFDSDFRGQDLETTYFDTRNFALRRARRRKDKYLTLRVRCYDLAGAYALSAKTEGQKFRRILPREQAEVLLADGISSALWADLLPADLVARLLDLAGGEPLVPVVTVLARRYAVEDPVDRLTLDVDVGTDTGKVYSSHVLEYKSTRSGPKPLLSIPLRPIKLSKFLWSLS